MPSSFLRNLVVLSVYSMLTAFTVLVASAYIFVFRLTVPMQTAVSSKMESDVIFPLTIEARTKRSIHFYPSAYTANYSLIIDEIQQINGTGLETNNEIFSPDANQTAHSGIGHNTSTKHDRPQKNQINIEAISDSWEKFRKTWGNSKSYVLSSSAITFGASLFQLLSAALIVFYGQVKSNDKLLRRIAFRWTGVNCVTVLILVAVVVSNGAMDSDPEKASGNPNFLSELEYNRETNTLYDFTPLFEVGSDTVFENNTSTNTTNNGTTVVTNSNANWYTISTFITKYVVANFYNAIISLDIVTLFIVILGGSFILRFYESPSYKNIILVK